MTYTVYGRPGCQPCQQAKSLLEGKDKEFKYINILDLIPVELDDFSEKYRSVPQIFHGETHLGGLQALREHLL